MLKLKKIMTLLMVGLIFFGCACTGSKETDEFEGKNVINFSVYDGGYGTQYAMDFAKEFNNSRTDNWAIKIIPEKRNGPDICAEINTGSANSQGYILSGLDIMSGVYSDTLEDLSDIIEEKVDGSDKNIESKILRKNDWYNVFKKNNKLYALPYTEGLSGMVIDHKLFVDNNWYYFASESADGAKLTEQKIEYKTEGDRLVFASSVNKTLYKEGDYILSAGKDGIYGTYDDGQPTNEQEWSTMLRKIAIKASPFIWGNQVETYVNLIFASLVANYSGTDAFNTIFSFDSNSKEVTLYDDSKIIFDVKNGYRVNEIKGIYKALEFLNKYFNPNNGVNYLHSACTDNGKSHYDAQNLFLLGYMGDSLNKLSAMLIDGSWWENEAKTMFNEIGKVDKERGYGKREYRFMLLPDLEGQAMEKTSIMAGDSGCIFLMKDSNNERLKVSKEFIKFLLQDKNLKQFTMKTGSFLAYDYELTEAELNQLTPFARNVYSIYKDEENIEIIRPLLLENISPICFATDKKGFYYSMLPEKDGALVATQTYALRQYGFESTWEGIKNCYNQSEWNKYLQQVQEQGFYEGI